MKKKNGFTLVELLAVIVILAIVLIIAVPGVLSIINQTKDNALDRQKDMIKEASRLYVTSESDVTWVGQDTKMTTVSLDNLKAKGYLDQKLVDPKTKEEISCAKTTVTKTGPKYTYDVQLCDQVNASPRLSSNMIPIVYKVGKWLKADMTNQNNQWYDYDNQQWANMATVTETTRDAYQKANIGTEVKMEDINTMFVWIPRFKYKLFNVDGTVSPVGNPNMVGDYLIDVQLEDVTTPKSTGTQNGQWLTHPAFTFGGEELSGFWFGKFETGYRGATNAEEGRHNEVTPSKIIIKPQVYAWGDINNYSVYQNALGMKDQGNVFGLTMAEDPHMTKNMEWGAMAYLTQSKYGKQGNPNYEGDLKEVMLNNHLGRLTGCGSDPEDRLRTDVCNQYDTAFGLGASTTGNITGIYDTAGGGWDELAAVSRSEDGRHFQVGETGFPQEELDQIATSGKYFDLYDYGADDMDYSRGHLGDATLEMGPFFESPASVSSWYEDYARFPDEIGPWIRRSGSYGSYNYAGVTNFSNSIGSFNTYHDNAFRISLL